MITYVVKMAKSCRFEKEKNITAAFIDSGLCDLFTTLKINTGKHNVYIC